MRDMLRERLFTLLTWYRAMCITEMSMMMACWKQNNFSFNKCVEKAQIAVKAISEQHIIGQGGCLQPKQATTLLKRHPNLHK
uniref:Uncharacterized protein n=1 Tax=Hucho hucho TaxID=62062 RepID=A0A4W5ND77_9TELE